MKEPHLRPPTRGCAHTVGPICLLATGLASGLEAEFCSPWQGLAKALCAELRVVVAKHLRLSPLSTTIVDIPPA